MNWIKLVVQRPPIRDMNQTDMVLVVYSDANARRIITIAFFDEEGKGTGWFEQGTFKHLPEPLYWMSIPPVP